MKILKVLGLMFFGVIAITLITMLVVGVSLEDSLFDEAYVKKYIEEYNVTELIYEELETFEVNGIMVVGKDDQVLKDELNTMSSGLIDYVFERREDLPSLNIRSIKASIASEVGLPLSELITISEGLEGHIDVLVGNLRKFDPDGNLSKSQLEKYADLGQIDVLESAKSEMIEVYMNNRSLSDKALKGKLLDIESLKMLCILGLEDDIDLDRIFNEKNNNNLFASLRDSRKVHAKNVSFYLPVYIGLVCLIMGIIAYSIRGTLLSLGGVLVFSSVISYILHLSNYLIIREINKISNPYVIQALKTLVKDVFSSTTRYSLLLFVGFVTCILGSFFFETMEKKRIRSSRFVFVVLVLMTIGYFGNEQAELAESHPVNIQIVSDSETYVDSLLECVFKVNE